MTTEEANKIIAEFMEWDIKPEWLEQPSWLGLDDLVPVWEKLKNEYMAILIDIKSKDVGYYFKGDYIEDPKINAKAGSIQEAAAIATAKAIKELKEKSE